MGKKFSFVLSLILRIIGSIPVILLFAFLSFWCAMIPIPVIGLIPFVICLLAEMSLLCLIWWIPPKDFDIPKDSNTGQILTLSGILLTAVNGIGVFAKFVPGFGTVAGFIINLICMILSSLVLGIFVIVYGIKKYTH